MTKTNLTPVYWLLGIALLLSAVMTVGIFSQNDVEIPEYEVYNDSAILEQLELIEDQLDELNGEILLEDNLEEFVEELVLAEINDEDFYEELFDVLESETDLEDVDDIYDLRIKDVDVKLYLNFETAKVDVEFKVYYYLDGDEEETEKALFKGTFYIVDLDEDDLDDAEIDKYFLDLLKIYE